jgi:signal transduction histidine kinase
MKTLQYFTNKSDYFEKKYEEVSSENSSEDIFAWIVDVLTTCMSGLDFFCVSGVVYPQHGLHAGVEKKFNLKKRHHDLLSTESHLKIIESSVMDILSSHQANNYEQFNYDIGDGVYCAVIPIYSGFVRPIGALWAFYPDANNNKMIKNLQVASKIIALSMHSEKANNALNHLGYQNWIDSNCFQAAARNIVLRCKQAIACADVIVWEKTVDEKFLVTIASTSPEKPVDMPIKKGLAGYCARNAKFLLIDDLLDKNEVREVCPDGLAHEKVVIERGWKTGMFVPLDIGGEILGVMGIYGERKFGMSELDKNIALAFSQQLIATSVHVRRLNDLLELENKFNKMAPSIQISMLAMENIHDATNDLVLAINDIGQIEEKFRTNRGSAIYKFANSTRLKIEHAQKLTAKIGRSSRALDKIVLGKCDLAKLLTELKASFEISNDVGIDFKLQLFDEEVIVYCDKEQIERALVNLLNNAVYFLGDGQKHQKNKIVSIKVVDASEYVDVIIYDNGPGIYKHQLPKIFEYTYTSRDKGMGFGLAITKRIVESHNGSIHAISDWGKFAEFTIRLPRNIN